MILIIFLKQNTKTIAFKTIFWQINWIQPRKRDSSERYNYSM